MFTNHRIEQTIVIQQSISPSVQHSVNSLKPIPISFAPVLISINYSRIRFANKTHPGTILGPIQSAAPKSPFPVPKPGRASFCGTVWCVVYVCLITRGRRFIFPCSHWLSEIQNQMRKGLPGRAFLGRRIEQGNPETGKKIAYLEKSKVMDKGCARKTTNFQSNLISAPGIDICWH